MTNIKIQARKYHKFLGILFALPLLYSAITGMLFAVADEFLHNDALADHILKFHTLEIVGLEEIYPFVVVTGVIGLIVTALIMLKK